MLLEETLTSKENLERYAHLMSAQEAAYRVLSLPLSKSSRQTIFVNTSPINERILMLKINIELRKLEEGSSEIFLEDIFTKYKKIPQSLEVVCLADFTTNYSRRNVDERNDDADNTYKEKKNSAISRYRR